MWVFCVRIKSGVFEVGICCLFQAEGLERRERREILSPRFLDWILRMGVS